MRRSIPFLLVALIVPIACSGGSDTAPTTTPVATPTTARPTTTEATATTTGASSTTAPTTAPRPKTATIRLPGAPPTLARVIRRTLKGQSAYVDPGLAEHLRGVKVKGLTLETHMGWLDGERIAVATNGKDAVYAIRIGDKWKVVAARLPSAGVEPWYDDEPLQLYVIGSDARPGQDVASSRADSHHVVTISGNGQRASIIGIPRDSYITTPGGGRDKFANAMPSYGPDGIQWMAESLTGLEFEGHYVTGFAGFTNLVDDFGPFLLEVLMPMNDRSSGAYFDVGRTEVDGEDALAFSRNRKDFARGDFQRQENQGWLMLWGLRAAQSRGFAAVPRLLEILDSHTSTNIPAQRQLVLAAAAMEVNKPVQSFNAVIPGSTGWAGNASVVFVADAAHDWFAAAADGPVTAKELGLD